MVADILLLVVGLVVILVAAELFTNGIEWFGRRLNLAEGAVGSVLAAVATAMPETLIPVIAILGPLVFGGETESSHAVGVGAILGAPFMLSTLAMFVTGIAILIFVRRGRRAPAMRVNVRILGRDVVYFIVAYTIAVGMAFVPSELYVLRIAAAIGLVVIYAVYVRAHFRDEVEEGEHEDLARLHLTRLRTGARSQPVEIDAVPGQHELVGTPGMPLILVQVTLALALIIVGAQVFVGAVRLLSDAIGLDTTILALIIVPIATELPEKFNSVLWVRNTKDTLAMGNITGAMVFQSCLPTVLGLLFTTWTFGPESALSFASAGVAVVATMLIFGGMLRRGRLTPWSLLIGGPLYLIYVVLALFTPLGATAAPH